MTDKKARMGDVARLSGLSRSTVDRVLNGRAGVRSETVRRVEDAMRALGYAPSSLSAHRVLQDQTVALVLPQGTNPFFEVIHAGLQSAMAQDAYLGAKFHVHRFDAYAPDTMLPVLRDLPDDTDAVLLVGVDNDLVTREITALWRRGIRVVTIVSDAPQARRFAYVGQDNFAAGRTAARLLAAMIPPGQGEVALLLGHLQFRHLLDRMSGFRQALGTARPDLTVIQPPAYGSDPEMTRSVVADLSSRGGRLRGAYLAGGGQPELITAISDSQIDQLRVIGHEVTPATRQALEKEKFQAVLAHNMFDVATRGLDIALGRRDPQDGRCAIDIFVRDNLPN